MRKFFALALVAVALLSGCTPAPRGKEGMALAVVNGEKITEGALLQEAQNLPPYLRPLLETPGGRLQLLEGMITRDLLLREAIKRGVDRRPDVQERLQMARRSILLESLIREITEKADVDEAALRKAYADNAAAFQVGERVRVKHVLFKDKAKAEAAAARVKAGEPFEAVMKSAPSAGGTGADLGFIEKGSFVKEFEAAAFAAQPGAVVGPVKTIYGFHIIRVEEKRPAGVKGFDEVKGRLSSELQERTQREALDLLMKRLRKEAKVEMLVKEEDGKLPPGMGKDNATPPAAPSTGTGGSTGKGEGAR